MTTRRHGLINARIPDIEWETPHGHPTATYTYDAYGKPTNPAAATDNPLLYTGQYTDPETGLQYLRARYYDPTTAQFTSRDPLEALTGQAYAYATDNPVNYADPSGLIFGIPGTPSWDQVGTRFVGAVDGITGTLDPLGYGTADIRDALGLSGSLDACSSDYTTAREIGQITALADLVVGGGRVLFEASPYEVRFLEPQRRGGVGIVNLRDTRISGDNRIVALDRHPIEPGGPARTHVDMPQRGIKHWPYG